VSQDPLLAHQADLELAQACAAGDEQAWERFIREYKPVLLRAADAMAPGGAARDIAEELFAELYGLRERDGERQSLFRYFQGRSSLATWLRAVLAQRYVDRLRAGRRTESLTDEASLETGIAEATSLTVEPSPGEQKCRAAVQDALEQALADLAPRDRLRLRLYYSQDVTLAAIGKLFGEHEATASRQLTRVRKELRTMVQARMREGHGYADVALADCLRLVMSDAGELDLGTLLARTADEIVQNERDRR